MAPIKDARNARTIDPLRVGVLRGGIDRKDFWRLDPQTGAEHQLTDPPSSFVIGDFDVSPDGTEIIFERVQESSSIALIEPTR